MIDEAHEAEPGPSWTWCRQRVGDVEKLLKFLRANGRADPDHFVVLDVVYNAMVNHSHKAGTIVGVPELLKWARRWLSDFPRKEAALLARAALRSERPYSNERAAEMLGLMIEMRNKLGIRFIGAVGHSKKQLAEMAADRRREADRERKRVAREGQRMPRSEYESQSVRAQAKAEGVAPSTIYRRRKKAENMEASWAKMNFKNATKRNRSVRSRDNSTVSADILADALDMKPAQLATLLNRSVTTVWRWQKEPGRIERELIAADAGVSPKRRAVDAALIIDIDVSALERALDDVDEKQQRAASRAAAASATEFKILVYERVAEILSDPVNKNRRKVA